MLPETNPTTGAVTKYVLFVYRMEPRSAVTADKTPDDWAETNVQVLREYRSGDSGTTPVNCVPGAGQTFETATGAGCAAMQGLAGLASVGGFNPYLVADYLTPSDKLPGSAAPFEWSAATRSVTLRVQFRQQAGGRVTTLPHPGLRPERPGTQRAGRALTGDRACTPAGRMTACPCPPIRLPSPITSPPPPTCPATPSWPGDRPGG